MATMSKTKQYTFFIAGALSMMSMTLSSYGIATVTPKLLRQFDAMQHYTLTSLMASIGMLLFLPIVGKVVDTIGRRPMLLLGGGIMAVASLATGFATNFPVFIIMRALITIGTACLTPIPSSTLPFVFERKELPKLYGIQGAFLALGTFFGSTIAGFLSDKGLAWLAVAYPGILALVACLVMTALLPDIPRKKLPSIDFGGIILMFLLIGPLMYISSFGSKVGWGSPAIIGMAVVLIVSFIIFINVEKRVQSPLIDLKLFKNPVFTAAILCTFLMVVYQSAMRVYVPLAVQNVLGQSAAVSGSVQLPRSILNMIIPAFFGAWVGKNQKNRVWVGLFLAGLFIAIGNIFMGFTTAASSLIPFFVGLGFTGIAESTKQSTSAPAIQSTLTADNMGSGMSLNSMMGSLGSAIGACVFGVIYDVICPDATIIADVNAACNVIFRVAAISGLLVCLLAYVFIRPKKTESAAAAS